MSINDFINKLFCGDVMDVIKHIPNESVDLIVTDPPYKCISGGRPKYEGQPSGILHKNDGKIFEHNNISPELWIPEVFRTLKNDTQCYIMINTINLEHYLQVCKKVGFKLHNILVWKKNNVTPSRWYMKNAEFTLFLRKGKAKTINNVGSKMVHEFDNIIGNKQHPTEKPIELMEYYILNSSQENDIIMDPFMGVGSTAIAARRHSRNFIGIEIDEEYYNKAVNRVSTFV